MRRSASNGRMCRSRRISRTASIRIRSPSGSSTYRSGCERRSTRGSPPSSSEANATAVARLPMPAGPWKRYACAGPSASAAASRRLASACSGMLSKLANDLLRDLPWRPCAVDGGDPLREELRELAVRRVDPRAEVVVLPLDPVAALADATRRLHRVDQEQKGPVGKQPADRLQVELEHALQAEAAREALVGERGVDVAVADDVRSALEAGRDHVFDELRPRGEEQRRLGPGPDRRVGEQELADPLAELGAAWLTRPHHVPPVGGERLGEEIRLGGLAGAVEAFEGDEHRV